MEVEMIHPEWVGWQMGNLERLEGRLRLATKERREHKGEGFARRTKKWEEEEKSELRLKKLGEVQTGRLKMPALFSCLIMIREKRGRTSLLRWQTERLARNEIWERGSLDW
jgi:hypothetical protein